MLFFILTGNASEQEIPTLYENRLIPTVADVKFLSSWLQHWRNRQQNTLGVEVSVYLFIFADTFVVKADFISYLFCSQATPIDVLFLPILLVDRIIIDCK